MATATVAPVPVAARKFHIPAREYFERTRRDIGPEQQNREMFHNGMHAVHAALTAGLYPNKVKPTVAIERVLRGGVPKLRFVDNGIGMNVDDLDNHLGRLFHSGGSGAADARFGMGARVAGLAWNRDGVEYVTWNGKDPAVRRILGFDASGEPGWVGLQPLHGELVDDYTEEVPAAKLPDMIRRAGHGTAVTMLGDTAGQDTVVGQNPAQATANNKYFANFVNTRYLRLPKEVRVTVPERRSATSNEWGIRSSDGDVVGLARALDEGDAIEASFTVALDHADVHVMVTHPPKTKRAGNKAKGLRSDVVPFGNTAAAVLPDSEFAGLDEIYEMHTGKAGMSRLQQFGISVLKSRTILVVYPHNAIANSYRTGLLAADGSGPAVPWEEWGEQFRERMPEQLAELIAASVEHGTGITKARDMITKRLGSLAGFVASKAFRLGTATVPAGAAVPGGSSMTTAGGNAGGSGNGTNPSTGTGTPRPQLPANRRTGSPGGNAVPSGDNGGAGTVNVAADLDVPDVVEVDAAHMASMRFPDRAANYDATSNTIELNRDFPGITVEVDQLLAECAGKRAGRTERNQAVEIVKGRMSMTLVEVVVRMRAAAKARPERGDEQFDLELALSPEALTAVVSASLYAWPETKRQFATRD